MRNVSAGAFDRIIGAGANAVLHAGNAPAGENLWCAYRAAYSGSLWTLCWAGPAGKGKRGKKGTAGDGVRT